MRTVHLDLASRSRFVVGVALLLAGGVLMIVGSFLPWATPGSAPGIEDVHSGWDLFERYGAYARPNYATVDGGYVYFHGWTGVVSIVGGVLLIGCAIVLLLRRGHGLPMYAFWLVAVVWFAAWLLPILVARQATRSVYEGEHWYIGTTIVALSSLLGAVGALIALLPRREESNRDSW